MLRCRHMAAWHHQGLLVTDLDRAAEFYVRALGGSWLSRPVALEGPGAEQVAELPGARLRLALIGLAGGAVELFEFEGDAIPEWATEAPRGSIPHFGLLV